MLNHQYGGSLVLGKTVSDCQPRGATPDDDVVVGFRHIPGIPEDSRPLEATGKPMDNWSPEGQSYSHGGKDVTHLVLRECLAR